MTDIVLIAFFSLFSVLFLFSFLLLLNLIRRPIFRIMSRLFPFPVEILPPPFPFPVAAEEDPLPSWVSSASTYVKQQLITVKL